MLMFLRHLFPSQIELSEELASCFVINSRSPVLNCRLAPMMM